MRLIVDESHNRMQGHNPEAGSSGNHHLVNLLCYLEGDYRWPSMGLDRRHDARHWFVCLRIVAWWSTQTDGLSIAVRVVPGARKSEIAGLMGDRLRIRLQAPAVEGKANVELQRFVAVVFGVRRSAVTILRGEHARDKTILIRGISEVPTDILVR